MRNNHAGRQLPRIDDLSAHDRVLIRTSMHRCMLLPDLLRTLQVGATNIHECGVLMKKAHKPIHIMLIPRASEACRKFICDIR